MRQLIKMTFGSHLYGTTVPDSDRDFKGIFVPTAKEIIMQRAVPTSINENTKKDSKKKNTSKDTDFENFSFHGFLRLCAEGQTVALDMLFAPREHIHFIDDQEYVFDWIQNNTDKLVSSQCASFVGYCNKQAAKYGLKGSRLDALQKTIELLSNFKPHDKMGDFDVILRKHISLIEHASIFPIVKKDKTGKVVMEETYLQVCGRKIGYNTSVKNALATYQGLFDKYGDRAVLAQKNQGIDWKALMHAVRVCNEAIEVLTTGKITFPRPEREYLIKIRKGELTYAEVSDHIAELLVLVKDAAAKSTLRAKPDYDFIEGLVCDVYRKEILR